MYSRGATYYIDRQFIGKTVASNATSGKDSATISELMATPYRTPERKIKGGNGYRPGRPNTAAKAELQTSHHFLKKDHANINRFHEELEMIRKREAEADSYDCSSNWISVDAISHRRQTLRKKRSFDSFSSSNDNSSYSLRTQVIKRCKCVSQPMFKPQSGRLADSFTPKTISPKTTITIKLKSPKSPESPKSPKSPKSPIKIKLVTERARLEAANTTQQTVENGSPKSPESPKSPFKIKLVTQKARLDEATKAQQAFDCARRLREHAKWNDCVAEPSPEFLQAKKGCEKDQEEEEGGGKTEKWFPWDSYGKLWEMKNMEKDAASTSHTAFWQERNSACEQPCTPPIEAAKSYQMCTNNETSKPGISPKKIEEISAKFYDSAHKRYPRNPQKDANKIFHTANKIAKIASKYVEEKVDTSNLIRKAEADIAMAIEEGVPANVLSMCIRPISAIPMRMRHLYKQNQPKAEKFIT